MTKEGESAAGLVAFALQLRMAEVETEVGADGAGHDGRGVSRTDHGGRGVVVEAAQVIV